MSEELRFAFLVDYVTFFGMREGSVSGTLAFFFCGLASAIQYGFLLRKRFSAGF